MLSKFTPKFLAIAFVSMLISSCSNGADVENMQVGAVPNADFGKYSHNIRLVEAYNDTDWDRRVSDKNFREALANSLASNGLANYDYPAYELSANIVQLTAPSNGFDVYVTSNVRYILRDTANGDIVVDKSFESRQAVSVNDAKMIVKRKRMVDENTINDNIAQFINYLRR